MNLEDEVLGLLSLCDKNTPNHRWPHLRQRIQQKRIGSLLARTRLKGRCPNPVAYNRRMSDRTRTVLPRGTCCNDMYEFRSSN